MAKLVVRPGEEEEETVVLETGKPIVLGRHKDREVPVWHRSISREHAQLTWADDHAFLEDLGSKRGTLVGRERRKLEPGEKVPLGARAHFRCGEVDFFFALDDGAEPEASAPAMTEGSRLGTQSLDQLLAGHQRGGGTALGLTGFSDRDRLQNKLEILLEVSQLLSSARDLDEVLSQILDLCFRILDIDRAIILLLDGEKLHARVSRDKAGRPVEPGTYSQSVVRQVVDRNAAASFADAQQDPRLKDAASVMAYSIMGAMAAPLSPRRENPLGALYVDSIRPNARYDEEDLEFLLSFASQAAVAIHNARLREKLEREAVTRSTLLRFFPPSAAESLINDGGESLRPKEAQATALFCDISGYTALSSRLSPMEVIELLNMYFPIMSALVFQHRGTLEKYIGDAMLAVWGVPYPSDNPALDAVSAAVGMQRAMDQLNEKWLGHRPEAGPREPLMIHIGINSGLVAAGNIGSDAYLQYATIGDATNVASRICGVAQDGEIVIDEETRVRMGAHPFELVALPPTEVKGKREPLSLHRVEWKAS